jgi:DNA-binding NarL/FixJ family response regulator
VLTVDDQPLFRDAARAVFDATPGFEPLAEVATGEAALLLSARHAPDLVFVDINLPGMGGLETSRRLAEREPRPLIVLMSADEDPVVEASPGVYGAAAFMVKEALCPRSLVALWNRLMAGDGRITPAG